MKFVVLNFVLLLSISAYAQWSPVPTPAVPINMAEVVVIDDAMIATAFFDGPYRSDDNGHSWYPITDGLPLNASWRAITLTPGGDVLISDSDGDLYRTSDNGETWVPSDDILFDVTSFTLIDGGVILATNLTGIWGSIDDGYTWEEQDLGDLPSQAIRTIAIAGDTTYVGLTSGVYRTNNGMNWEYISAQIPGGVFHIYRDGSRLYAYFTDPDVIYYTNDEGLVWFQTYGLVAPGLISDILRIGDDLFCCGSGGIYRFNSSIDTWEIAGTGIPHTTYSRTLTTAPNGDLIGMTFRGVYRSNDDGLTWTASSDGIDVLFFVNDLLSIDDGLLIAAEETFWIYTPGNPQISEHNTGLTRDARPVRLVATDSDIYATGAIASFVKSNDGGETWIDLYDAFPDDAPALMAARGNTIFVADGIVLYQTTDAGASFEIINQGWSFVSNILGVTDQYILAGSRTDALYRSEIGIWDWENLVTDMPAGLNLQDLGINGTSICLATSGGIFRSIDHGSTWHPITESIGGVQDADAILVTNELVVADVDDVVYVSLDDGETWTPSSVGLPIGFQAFSFTIKDDIVYAGGNGLWQRPVSEFLVSTQDIATVKRLSIYPNPGSGTLHVSVENAENLVTEVRVTDCSGSISIVKMSEGLLDLSFLSPGMYFITIKTASSNLTTKIVLQ